MFRLRRDHRGAWDARRCCVRGEDNSFPFTYFPNPKFRLLHLGWKPEKCSPASFSSPVYDATNVRVCNSSAWIPNTCTILLSLKPSPRTSHVMGMEWAQLCFQCHPGNCFPLHLDVTSKRCSCHLSGLTSALQLLGTSHSPGSGDWRISFLTPPFWNCWVFSFHTTKSKNICPNYTLKKSDIDGIKLVFCDFISGHRDTWG